MLAVVQHDPPGGQMIDQRGKPLPDIVVAKPGRNADRDAGQRNRSAESLIMR
jgi:hypothetical protein